MVFSTYAFLFWFLPVALAVYYALPSRSRAFWLTLSSYVFYGWLRPEYCALLAGVTLLNFYGTKALLAARSPNARRRWLWLCVGGSLAVLGFFKYAGMLGIWTNELSTLAGLSDGPWLRVLDLALPIGISFFTFQAISYSVDVHRGDAAPADDLMHFAAYISMFPQLIAGPIVRYHTLAAELRSRAHSAGKAWLGLNFFAIGLAKKVLIADSFALLVPLAFGSETPSFAGAWVGTLGYMLQIYFDFSAYSDMAVGLGLLLGFHFPQNFDSPYKSASITEFWRRWHISLSTWLRDYLYVPLGGNRRGRARTYLNLMIVMLLGGLWHGASVLFLLWGLWHGVLLALERALGDRHPLARLPRPLAILLTNLSVMLGWVLFRASDLAQARRVFAAMFSPAAGLELAGVHPLLPWLALGGLGVCWFARNSWQLRMDPTPLAALRGAFLLACALIATLAYSGSPFLYFQF